MRYGLNYDFTTYGTEEEEEAFYIHVHVSGFGAQCNVLTRMQNSKLQIPGGNICAEICALAPHGNLDVTNPSRG